MIALDFTRFDAADKGSLAILVGDLSSRTGIYWLTFDDGYEYVGQSVEMVRRLATHRRKQPGSIVTVAFASVPVDRLDHAERWFIEQRDNAGARLRNKLITRAPGGPAPGTYTVSPGVTVSLPWERAARGRITAGEPPSIRSATDRQARQWDQLQAHEAWPDIRAFLRGFLRETMSSPDLTAGRLWTVSALPNTVRLPGWYRLCTLNVGRIEAVYIGQDEVRGPVICWNLAVPDDTEGAALGEGLDRIDPQGAIGVDGLTSYADPVAALTIPGARLARQVLDLPEAMTLAYRFNTRHQRQGMALQGKGHNPLMATDLLRQA